MVMTLSPKCFGECRTHWTSLKVEYDGYLYEVKIENENVPLVFWSCVELGNSQAEGVVWASLEIKLKGAHSKFPPLIFGVQV